MNVASRTLTGLLGATVGAGIFLVGTSTGTAAAEDRIAIKREDSYREVLAVDDRDDDDDETTRSRSGPENGTSRGDGTGVSRSRRDGTNSRMTGVSRDRDNSRRDLTRDWTRDGGDKTRDFSRNLTNDRSRNDTR